MFLMDESDENQCRASESVEKHLMQYLLRFEELRRVAEEVERYLTSALDEQAITYHLITARAKSYESYKKKARKTTDSGALKYRRLPEEIDDCVAARVIVFTEQDQKQAVDEFRTRFTIPDGEDRNPTNERTNPLETGWGYDSHHFVISGLKDDIGDATPLGRYLAEGRRFELQVRTVAAHAWAEYEHDVRYKPERFDRLSGEERGMVNGLFKSAAEARMAMDRHFGQIEELLTRGSPLNIDNDPGPDPRPVVRPQESPLDEGSLKRFLAKVYPEARTSADSAVSWMLRVLRAVDIETIEHLEEQLASVDSARVAELMDYGQIPTRLRRLDDELLSALGESYVEKTQSVADDHASQRRRERYMPARHNRLSGKLRIYEVIRPGHDDHRITTAAGALRALIEILLAQKGRDAAEISGLVSASPDSFGEGARAAQWRFQTGDSLWVHGNLSRALAEQAMSEVFERLQTDSARVLRSGDDLLPLNQQRGDRSP